MNPLHRPHPRLIVAFAAVLGVLTLAGCGASTPAATHDPDTTHETDAPEDAGETSAPAGGNGSGAEDCNLWTLDEVTAATGIEATDASSTDVAGQSSCIFTDASGNPTATYVVMTPEAGIAPQAGYDAVSDGTEPVSGIGDQAKWHEMGTLYALSGANLYIVTVFGADLDEQEKKDASIDLARIALGRS